MYRFILNRIRKKIPKISETELIALTSGTTSVDRSILEGRIKLPNVKLEKYNENFLYQEWIIY